MGVTGGCLHLENSFLDCEERDIKCSSTQIENQNILLANAGRLFVESISNGCSCRLVDDTHNIKTGDDSGVLGGLTLRVIEVSRNGDDGVLHGGTKVSFCNLTHFCKNHG
ncbi:hypothetical protein IC582_020961 [Cucumis melo]